MYIFLIVIHVIACLVLVMAILFQAGRGGGLSDTFGSGSSSTIFGTSASNFLVKATEVCAIIFLLTSLSIAVLSSHKSKSLMQLEKIKQALPAAEKEALPAEEPKKEAVPVEEEGTSVTE